MTKKVSWVQVLVVLVGALLGSMIAGATKGVVFLAWLSFGTSFALAPTTLDLGVLHLTFGFGIDVCIGMLIGLIVAMLVARKVR